MVRIARHLAVIGLSSGLIAACAAGPALDRADAGPDRYRADTTACTHAAQALPYRQVGPSLYPVGSGTTLDRTELAAKYQANQYHRCMTAKGYGLKG